MRFPALVLCLALLAPAACATRDTAYRFRGPGMAAVGGPAPTSATPRLAPRPAPADPHGPTRIATNDRRGADSAASDQRTAARTTVVTTDLEAPPPDVPAVREVPAPDDVTPPPRAPEIATDAVDDPSPGPTGPPAISEAVEPAERAEPAPAPARSLPEILRGMVGNRHARAVTDVDVALNALEAIGTELDDELAKVTTGAALVALAEARRAMGDGVTPLLGDLLVLLDSSSDDPVIAVVVGIDERGTIEIVHLTRGIVRRSFLTLATPNRQRDDAGAILNTLIRHKEGSVPAGTKYLAGQLFLGHIRLDELVER